MKTPRLDQCHRVQVKKNGVEIRQRLFNIATFGIGLESFALLTTTEIERLATQNLCNQVYVNPEWTVLANANVPFKVFYQEANAAVVCWKRYLAQLCPRKEVERCGREMHHATRQLAISGVFFVNGKSMHPKMAKLMSQQ